MRKTILAALCFLLLPIAALADNTAYEDTLSGKQCKESENFQQISCNYKIGKDLEFSIDGIGMLDTGITFAHSNFNGDYYATFGIRHGCIIVKHGAQSRSMLTDFAFVSPKTGKVYQTWEACKAGM